jgi:2-oxoglutarate dehydrogenase E1 component
MGVQRPRLQEWLQQQIEPSLFTISLSIEEKKSILKQLNHSELFEIFLQTKFVGQKRFSVEGAESLIPILDAIVQKGADQGIDKYIIGMAHRGRLNVLANILHKSYTELFSEFEEAYASHSFQGSGDVKYHMGFMSNLTSLNGKKVEVTLAANPSHLESVAPVIQGKARATQILIGDDKKMERVLPIIIHGDAAIPGQGIVYETLQLYNLKGYSTGGTIHIIINNQIGFTTLPKDSRSTKFCTDIAQTFYAPVFHVNAEDLEGCIYATHLAISLRQRFHCDVFIELNCYRKYGHNEADEPAYTQPLEYKIIRKKQSIRQIYREQLINQGVLEKQLAETLESEFKESLHNALKGTEEFKLASKKRLSISPKEEVKRLLKLERSLFKPIVTGVPIDKLHSLTKTFCNVPEGLSIHPKLQRVLKHRLNMLAVPTSQPCVDWGMAEHLAFATLLDEGTHVRLSGQDSRRGTFSHRHAMWADQNTEKKYFPLSHLHSKQGRFDVFNSPLSEYAVLGFEFGYSLVHCKSLILWEAQFGDFVNGAQIILDEYIATAEQKWNKKSHLTLLLPHGYEGQGPDHSSSRIERFLQLAGDYNMLITNPSTPVQFFHLLRRQVLQATRKPLIVFTPKRFLRHSLCLSALEEFENNKFEEVLEDPTPPKNIKRLIFCSGRLFFDLIEERERNNNKECAIIRIEQLFPLHLEKIKSLLEKYKGFKECYWVQEEPSNMGAWDYIRPYLRDLLERTMEPYYVGRGRSASPAAGSFALHKREHTLIMEAAFAPCETPQYQYVHQQGIKI